MTDTHSTAQTILTAARVVLLDVGFAALSTRRVAKRADVPLSQIHYHFGSKEQLILAILHKENVSLIERQADMFALAVPLSDRWRMACDYLDQDLDSGYVRVLQEMMTAGWSSEEVRGAVNLVLDTWAAVLTDVIEQGRSNGADFGSFTTAELVTLISATFLGAEAMLLLKRDDAKHPIRQALRRIGDALALLEKPRKVAQL